MLRHIFKSEKWHHSQVLEPAPRSEVILTLLGLAHELKQWILGFGPDVTVLEPPNLVEDIAEAHRKALATYSGKPRMGRSRQLAQHVPMRTVLSTLQVMEPMSGDFGVIQPSTLKPRNTVRRNISRFVHTCNNLG